MALGREHVTDNTHHRILEVGYVITHQEMASLKVLLKRSAGIIRDLAQGANETGGLTAVHVVDILNGCTQNIQMMEAILGQVKVPPNERSGVDLEATYPILSEINSEKRFKKLL